MNHNTPFRLRGTIVLALVVATVIAASTATAAIDPRLVNPAAGAMVAVTGQLALPPGATLEPTVASPCRQEPRSSPPVGSPPPARSHARADTVAGQPTLPPGATLEPIVAPSGTARRRRSRPRAVRPGSRGPGWVRLGRCGSGGWNRVGSRTAPWQCSARIQALRAAPTASAALRASARERCGRVWMARPHSPECQRGHGQTSLPIPRENGA